MLECVASFSRSFTCWSGRPATLKNVIFSLVLQHVLFTPVNRVLNLGPEIKRYAMSMEHSKNVLSMVVGQLAKHGLHYHMPGWKRK